MGITLGHKIEKKKKNVGNNLATSAVQCVICRLHVFLKNPKFEDFLRYDAVHSLYSKKVSCMIFFFSTLCPKVMPIGCPHGIGVQICNFSTKALSRAVDRAI